MAALAVWALYEHAVVPALRFLVTHPATQVIDELGERLRIGIRPFQRTKRQALIHSLLADRRVQAAAEKYSRDEGVTLPSVLRTVDRYAREIVPAFNAYLYFRVGYWIGRTVARALYRVRLGYVDAAGLAKIDPDATVVFVMNHRSNMDYVLAGYLAADQTALSYAVGEWARLWPLSALIRAMGAYFVRRNSADELYRRVLERDLVFVPLGINYDRVLEDRTLLSPVSIGRAKTVLGTFRFVAHNAALMLKSEWHRFGYACVNFGAPVSMREYSRAHGIDFQRLAGEERRQAMARLGRDLMDAVGRIVPVVPVALIAHIFLERRSLTELDLKAEVGRLLERLSAAH